MKETQKRENKRNQGRYTFHSHQINAAASRIFHILCKMELSMPSVIIIFLKGLSTKSYLYVVIQEISKTKKIFILSGSLKFCKTRKNLQDRKLLDCFFIFVESQLDNFDRMPL